MLTSLRIPLFVAAIAVAVFIAWVVYVNWIPNDTGPIAVPGVTAAALIARGQYVATAGNCVSCHTSSDGEFMAGGVAFMTPFGKIYSTNITPDPETGIGRWSQRDFINSLRHGVRPDGEHLYPAFPYTAFTRMTDEDAASLYAYFISLAPIRQTAPDNALSFPFNLRWLMAFWKALFFSPGQMTDQQEGNDTWNRGAYLVQALAHCGACHTPRNWLGAEQDSLFGRGGEYLDQVIPGVYRPWSTPNLSSSVRGLGLWSAQELSDYLHTGRNSFLETFGPMNEVIMHSTSHLTELDIAAMSQYLKDLPAVESHPGKSPDAQIMGRGRTVYNLHCGTCHLPTGKGDPEMGPRLNQGSLVVQDNNPASMINVILYSPTLPDSDLPRQWRHPMEEYQYLLDDEEVAAVATYIRFSWDNAAGIVTPAQVARQR